MLVTVQEILFIGAALLGVIVGSFLNALSFRFNTGRRFFSPQGMGGRSRCMQCGHTLGSLDLVPVLSYLFLGGKCRYCSSRISWQYPLVEVLAGVLAAGVFVRVQEAAPLGSVASILGFAFWFVVWMILLFVVIYDLKHKIIPWSCSLSLIALAMVGLLCGFVGPTASFDTPHFFVIPSLWALLAGPLLALPLFLLSLVSGGRWMGWADSVLEFSLGAFVGLSAGATALMLAFWSGAIVGIALIVLSRIFSRLHFFGYTIKSEMPFAPFLIFGAALAYFFHVDFFSNISLF